MLQHLCLDHRKCSQGCVGTLQVTSLDTMLHTAYSKHMLGLHRRNCHVCTIGMDIHIRQHNHKEDVITHKLPQKKMHSYCRLACDTKLHCISCLLFGSDNTENRWHACSKAFVG